jgi:hypothetical protein
MSHPAKLKRSKSPPKLKRSASMPNKKFANPKLAKIFTLPIEVQCEIFKTIDLEDLNTILLTNKTLKTNVLSCVESVIIKNDSSDVNVLKKLPRLKHIAHRNDKLYIYVNNAIRDKDYKMLEMLLKYGRFSKEGPCYSCDFLNDIRALKLGFKYNKVDINQELKYAITQEELGNEISYVRFLLKYAVDHKIPINYTSLIERAKKFGNRDMMNHLTKHKTTHGKKLDYLPKDYWVYHDQGGLLNPDQAFFDMINPEQG